MPKRISVRKAAESNFCAAVVASIACGGLRQLSQLPQRAGGSSPKWRSRKARRQPAVSTRVASAFSRSRSPGWRAGSTSVLDAAAGQREILGAPEQPGLGRLAVAAGAAGLLIIGLDRFGQAGMGDEAHVGLVDAHAEGDGRDHHHVLAADERGLVARPHRRHRARHDRAAPAARPRRAGRRSSRPCRGSARRRCRAPAARRAAPSIARSRRRAGGRDSGCWAGRSRRGSGRPWGCRAGRECRRGCACPRSRSAPAAARRGRRRARAGSSR